MEDKVKHLEMIQGVINRMANNSFLLKTRYSRYLLIQVFV